IALLPDFVVAEDLAAGRLAQVLPDLDAGDVEILAMYPSKRFLEPRVRRFIDLMVDELAG
ncbi:LysR substrate-binding domain-containing protein, partial [Pseudomonas sp. K5002]